MRRMLHAILATVLTASAHAQEVTPAAADLLFETPQLQATAPGTTLTYRYVRTSGIESAFGPTVEDRIRLMVEPGDGPANRTLRVDLFSGPRHRAAGPFEDVSGNPVLALFLEHHVEALARVLSANPRYLKNAIRAGLRDKASVASAAIDLNGRSVPGWRVEVHPFAQEANKARMRGLDSLTYVFLVSDAVPGAVASIEATATGGGTLLKETLTYDPTAG